jgi:hypothetical protein
VGFSRDKSCSITALEDFGECTKVLFMMSEFELEPNFGT